jgi:multicomponent Na+:H+ antiporter subunit D
MLFFKIILFFKIALFKSINQLSNISSIPLFKFTIILIFLSLAGIPPLSGFFGQTLIFFYLFIKQNLFLLFLFFIFSLFSLYFYIQNIKVLLNFSNKNLFLVNNFKVTINLNKILMLNLITINLMLGFFFIETLFLFLLNLVI